jgi:DNA-binding transcriptional LysR family regulator
MNNPVFNGSRLRLLDYDDLLILRALSEGMRVHDAARVLGVTQPAVTQRLRKMSFVFGEENIMEYRGRNAYLTEAGKNAAQKAISAIVMLDYGATN